MTTRKSAVRQDEVHSELGRTAAKIFATNDRMNQLVIEHLDPAAWRAKPPGNVRTIAAIFTHIHNVRTKWIRLTAPHFTVPPQLNRSSCTPQQARMALAQSASRCEEMLAEALSGGGRIERFHRDGWAQPWPVGPEMLCYMLAHEAQPSRAGLYAGASARLPAADEDNVRALELGKTMERGRGFTPNLLIGSSVKGDRVIGPTRKIYPAGEGAPSASSGQALRSTEHHLVDKRFPALV